MQVLYYSPSTWGNTDFYRTTGVLPFINHPDIITRDISHFGQISQWDLEGADAIIIQRPGTPNGLQMIKNAKMCGLKIILDYDDDVLNVDFFNPTFAQYHQQREIILRCIKLADEVWCSTESVRKSFGKGIVIPNALNEDILGKCAKSNETKNIVWRGGSTHEADMYENADQIAGIVNNHPELAFYFIGHRFTYLEQRCGDNYNSVEGMPITHYFQYLKQLKPKAMIFPLCDTMLNRGKSNISMIESHLVGGAYFGNKNLPEFDLDFVMPLDKFYEYISDEALLKEKHTQGCKYIEENLLLSDINKLRINSLLNI
jgi:hypothetical protein